MSTLTKESLLAQQLLHVLSEFERHGGRNACKALDCWRPYAVYIKDHQCLLLNRSYKVIGTPGYSWCDYDSELYDHLRFSDTLLDMDYLARSHGDTYNLCLSYEHFSAYKKFRTAYLKKIRDTLYPLFALAGHQNRPGPIFEHYLHSY